MSGIKKDIFGMMPDGRKADMYTLENDDGWSVKITNFGATVVSLYTPDRGEKFTDIVLGYDVLDGYIHDTLYLGATIGRCANRIAEGTFFIDGKQFHVARNNGPNHLHGGINGFNKVLWNAAVVESDDGPALKFTYRSRDGEENYPGNLNAQVVFTWTHGKELRIDYEATTDAPTLVNFTHHSYFNMSGHEADTILDHLLSINADSFTPISEQLIPTGEIRSVQDTYFDFRVAKQVGRDINNDDEQLRFGNGYDHNWVVKGYDGTLKPAATLYEERSGRFLEVFSTDPGMQFYAGNFLDGSSQGKNGKKYPFRSALCLEMQRFPDAINHDNFPDVVLRPGEIYRKTTVYKFSVR